MGAALPRLRGAAHLPHWGLPPRPRRSLHRHQPTARADTRAEAKPHPEIAAESAILVFVPGSAVIDEAGVADSQEPEHVVPLEVAILQRTPQLPIADEGVRAECPGPVGQTQVEFRPWRLALHGAGFDVNERHLPFGQLGRPGSPKDDPARVDAGAAEQAAGLQRTHHDGRPDLLAGRETDFRADPRLRVAERLGS